MTYLPPSSSSLSLIEALTAAQGCGYITSSGLVSLSTTSETPFFYINNPSTNVLSWVCISRKFFCQTAAQTAAFTYYWNPTVSANGTVQPVSNLRNNPEVPTSKMGIYYLPTSSVHGVKLSIENAGNNEYTSTIPLIVDPGYSLLITCTPTASSNVVFSELVWFEVNL